MWNTVLYRAHGRRMTGVQGIDVSNNNGTLDWTPWRDQISFAMMKASEGVGFIDSQFGRNWNQAWRISGGKMVRVAYHFGHPGQDPVHQADILTTQARKHGLKPGDHYALDLEVTDGQSPDHVAAWAQKFAHRINHVNPGHRCLIYTYPAFAEAGNCAGLEPWFLWIANYGVAAPAVPAPWHEWKFWQYQGTGIDRDMWNGTEQELLDFMRMPAWRR